MLDVAGGPHRCSIAEERSEPAKPIRCNIWCHIYMYCCVWR